MRINWDLEVTLSFVIYFCWPSYSEKKKIPLGKYLLSFCRKNTREMNVEVLPVSLSLLLTLNSYLAITLRERCPSMEFFLVRIFSHSDRLRRFTVFSPNTGKYRSEKTPYLDTFQAVLVVSFIDNKKKTCCVWSKTMEHRTSIERSEGALLVF